MGEIERDEAARKAYMRYRYAAYRQRDDIEFILKLVVLLEVSQLFWWVFNS